MTWQGASRSELWAGLLVWAVLGWARLLCRRLLGWACAVPTAAGLGSAAVPTAALAAAKCSRIGAPPGLLAGPKSGTAPWHQQTISFLNGATCCHSCFSPGFGTAWWPPFWVLVFEALVRSSMRLA